MATAEFSKFSGILSAALSQHHLLRFEVANLHNKKEPQTSRIQKAHSRHSNLNKMKRQINIQQVKEHEKCPPSQTKEKEIGNLSEKEFRIMIIKMIQNLENKMEIQINSLETKIEKMQEMFNKDLEEIKKESIKNE